MEHLSNDYEDHPNQHKNSHKLYNQTGNLVLSLLESQWKLRQQYNQNFPMEGKSLHNKHLGQKKEIGPIKSRTGSVTVRDPNRKVNHQVRSFEMEKLYQTSPGLSVPPE